MSNPTSEAQEPFFTVQFVKGENGAVNVVADGDLSDNDQNQCISESLRAIADYVSPPDGQKHLC
jgi:hypothetical protein